MSSYAKLSYDFGGNDYSRKSVKQTVIMPYDITSTDYRNEKRMSTIFAWHKKAFARRPSYA